MEFIDLKQQYRAYKDEIHAEIEKVMTTASFIRGPVLEQFENEMAAHTGSKHVIGCSSGTDALLLGLMALGVKPGDEVIVPDFTFIATAEVVAMLGARPVFVDVQDDTLNIDHLEIKKAISPKTVGIIPVSLYGQCADMDEINTLAAESDIWVMEDAAQSYGATYRGRKSGTLSTIGTTSFFPAKPLGCYGDGGAVFSNDDALAMKIRMILNHGQEQRYRHKIIGINGRLDTIQAAVLTVKLKHFDEEMSRKQQIADKFSVGLGSAVRIPMIREYNTSVWAQYTVRHSQRETIIEALKEKGVPTAIHYPIPLHNQECFSNSNSRALSCPVSQRASNEVFSLPMHPFLNNDDINLIVATICEVANG